MTYCTSCGQPIPEGQGSSCSMCYGDVDHGRDGYYRDWLETLWRDQEVSEEQAKQLQQQEELTP